jgi:WW domain-containing oxidoreductase
MFPCSMHGCLFDSFPWLQGAATQCYVALHPQVKGVSGEYFMDSNKAKASSLANDAELAKKLWDFSLSLTGQN